MKRRILKLLVIISSLATLILSLTYNAYKVEGYDGINTQSSLSCFVMGSTAILGGGILEWIIWLANPLCLISIFFIITDNEKAPKFALAALLIAMSFSLWNNILISESGATGKILSLELGYYIWLISIATLTIGTHFYFKKYKEVKFVD